MLDYDGDGFLDLFFVNGAALRDPMPPGGMPDKRDPKFWNRLYHNNRDGTFTDVTEHAGVQGHGYGMGVAVGDFDNDGRPDLYVTNYGAQHALPQQRRRYIFRCHWRGRSSGRGLVDRGDVHRL